MKQKNIKPKSNNKPSKNTRSGAVLERDILFTIISMLVFALVGGKADPLYIIPSVLCVIGGELLTAIASGISEPDSVRNSRKYTNREGLFPRPSEFLTEEDSDSEQYSSEYYSNQVQPVDAANDSKALLRTAIKQLDKDLRMTSSAVRGSKQNDPQKKVRSFVLVMATFIFAVAMTIIIPVVLSITNDNSLFDPDDQSDIFGSSYDSEPFYSEESFLEKQTEEVFDKLSMEDTEWIKGIGSGDAQGILEMIDWNNYEIMEDDRSVNEDQAYIRYIITSNSQDYKFAIKFRGSNLAEDDSDASVTGIAACPYKVWQDFYDEYDNNSQDLTYTDLENSVNEAAVSVGDISFYDTESILLW